MNPLAPPNPALPIYDDGDYAPGSREWAQRQNPIIPREAVPHVMAADQALRVALRNCGLGECDVDTVASGVWTMFRGAR